MLVPMYQSVWRHTREDMNFCRKHLVACTITLPISALTERCPPFFQKFQCQNGDMNMVLYGGRPTVMEWLWLVWCCVLVARVLVAVMEWLSLLSGAVCWQPVYRLLLWSDCHCCLVLCAGSTCTGCCYGVTVTVVWCCVLAARVLVAVMEWLWLLSGALCLQHVYWLLLWSDCHCCLVLCACSTCTGCCYGVTVTVVWCSVLAAPVLVAVMEWLSLLSGALCLQHVYWYALFV